MLLDFVLLQAAKPTGGASQFVSFLPLIGIIVVFYFFMIRPQQKKAKDAKLFRDTLKKGDSVVTIGGLHGKIASVENDDTIIIEVDKGIRLKFEKSAISNDSTKKAMTADTKVS